MPDGPAVTLPAMVLTILGDVSKYVPSAADPQRNYGDVQIGPSSLIQDPGHQLRNIFFPELPAPANAPPPNQPPANHTPQPGYILSYFDDLGSDPKAPMMSDASGIPTKVFLGAPPNFGAPPAALAKEIEEMRQLRAEVDEV